MSIPSGQPRSSTSASAQTVSALCGATRRAAMIPLSHCAVCTVRWSAKATSSGLVCHERLRSVSEPRRVVQILRGITYALVTWCPRQDSNLRPSAPEADALSPELRGRTKQPAAPWGLDKHAQTNAS